MFKYGHKLLYLSLQQSLGHCQNCKFSKIASTVQEVTVPVPWGHVAGKWWGDSNIQPVLGFHGWEDNSGTFDALVPYLNIPSFLAVDLIGHGKSSYYPMGSTHHFIDALVFVRRIVDHYKLDKISIIGHSFGSAMGFLYSAMYPDEVEKFVSIDCARSLMMPKHDSWLSEIRKTLDRTLSIEEKMSSDPPGYTYEELLTRYQAGSLNSLTLNSCAILLERGIQKSAEDESKCYLSRDPRVKLNWLSKMPEEFIMACASRMECKVLSIRGKEGFLYGDKREKVYLASLAVLKHCEHHDVDGSHHVHLNNPENVAPLINKFFNS